MLPDLSAARLDFLPVGHRVVAGPVDEGVEERWLVELLDGEDAPRRVVIARLSADLAADESIRRRWLRDVEALRDLATKVWSLLPIEAIGPRDVDPRARDAPAPWRIRPQPEGQDLASWLAARGAAPLDEAAAVLAAIADALAAVHAQDAVVRDLHPRHIVLLPEGRAVFADIGLSRVNILSSRTASSLLIEASPYASPEQVMKTVVDRRSDVYGLGVLAWQALTGALPYGDAHALLREHRPLPALSSLRADVPAALSDVVGRALSETPDARPLDVEEIAWACRGGGARALVSLASTTCQHCRSALRPGQRLCLACGRVAVVYRHADVPAHLGWSLRLDAVGEDAKVLEAFHGELAALVDDPAQIPELWLSDGISTYSAEEKARGAALPLRLFADLDEETAKALAQRLAAHNVQVTAVSPRVPARWFSAASGWLAGWIGSCVGAVYVGVEYSWVAAALALGAVGLGAFAIGMYALASGTSALADRKHSPRLRLRARPMALPASDPWVARIAALMQKGTVPGDVRGLLGQLALGVQRVVDRRVALRGSERAALELASAPIEGLIAMVERQSEAIVSLDAEIASLDEGELVRLLSLAEARKDETARSRALASLDRLRAVEEARTRAFSRLLETTELLHRSVEHSLVHQDPEAEHERWFQLALASLERDALPERTGGG